MVTYAEENPFPYILINESATDGSAVPNPPTDYRHLFVGEDGLFHLRDSAGTVTTPSGAGSGVASDTIWDAAGDLAVGSGADTAAKLAKGSTNGMALTIVGGSVAWALPPGYQYDYAEVTGAVTITGTSEGSPTNIVVGASVAYDGSTAVLIEAFIPDWLINGSVGDQAVLALYDGTTSIGIIAAPGVNVNTTTIRGAYYVARKITPSNASHTYKLAGYKTAGGATVQADVGAGAAGNVMPGFIRITKV